MPGLSSFRFVSLEGFTPFCCAKILQNRPQSSESIESVETVQGLDLLHKTGKPSQFQAIDIISLFELLRRGPWVRVPAGSPP
jgi:hypothetical protein